MELVRTYWRWIAVGGGLALVVAVLSWGASVDPFEVARRFEAMGPPGALLYILVYAVACPLQVPATPLTLGAGFIYGAFWGPIVAFIGSTAGSVCAFLVGRHLVRGPLERRLEGDPRFHAIDRAIAGRGIQIVGLVRLSPLFPYNITSYVFGATRVRLRDYVVGGTTVLPIITVIAGVGATLTSAADWSASSGQGAWTPVLQVVGLLATVWVVVYMTRAARAELVKVLGESREER